MKPGQTQRRPEHYFSLGCQQQAQLALTFLLDRCPVSRVVARLAMLQKRHFVAEATLEELAAQPLLWGGEARGAFIADDTSRVQCTFGTRLVRVVKAAENQLYLVLELPAGGAAPEAAPQDYDVWFGIFSGGSESALPALAWHELPPRICRLAEISSLGLRLDIGSGDEQPPRIAYKDNILLRASLGRQDHYLLGQVIRSLPNALQPGVTSYGCNFLAWCERISAKTSWLDIDPERGVGFLPRKAAELAFRVRPV